MSWDGTGNNPDNWRALFQAAVLELDRQNLPTRIQEAKSAIMDRAEELMQAKSSETERMVLLDALNTLRDLSSMLNRERQTDVPHLKTGT